MITIKEFAELLDSIQDNPADGIYFESNPEIDHATSVCNELLITHDGGVNYNNITTLEELGYTVYPVEKDSFGWLVGGVRNNKTGKVLTFG